MQLVMEWFLIGIFRVQDRLGVNLVLAFVALARVRETDWSALSDQSWFL